MRILAVAALVTLATPSFGQRFTPAEQQASLDERLSMMSDEMLEAVIAEDCKISPMGWAATQAILGWAPTEAARRGISMEVGIKRMHAAEARAHRMATPAKCALVLANPSLTMHIKQDMQTLINYP